MHQGKIPVETRSRSLDATHVLVERSKLSKWYESTRWDGFVVSQCSGTMSEMVAECERLAPCILVVSQESLEKLDADEFRALVGVGSSVRVLVLGSQKSSNLVEKFLAMGCMGYLPNDVPAPIFRRAVRAIALGQVWADRSTITQVMKSLLLKQSVQVLTARERDILRLIASGLSNRVIADRLYITYETVRWHIRGLYSKLGVQDRFSAIVYGKRLLDSEGLAASGEVSGEGKVQAPVDGPAKRERPKAIHEESGSKSFLN